MHDPQTVAHEIYLGPKRTKKGKYRSPFITIWHIDPENFKTEDGGRKLGGRSDDSCGWFAPLYTEAEWQPFLKLAKDQYSQIYARQIAESKGETWAYVANHPETMYEVIYWCWRAIKHQTKKEKGWQYGNGATYLTSKELQEIMQLASNPVDNFKHYNIKSEAGFIDMFSLIWRAYRRFTRPWYKHPRWHIHHWKVQFVFLRDFKRRYFDKCSICGTRGFKAAAYSDWSGKKIWCNDCNSKTAMQPPLSR